MTPGARRILEVASRLFYRDGIHAVGVDTIAAESGVTKRTLYDRFGSKDTLVASYLRQRHNVWWEQFEHRIAAAELHRDHAAYDAIREHKQAVRDRLVELVAEVRADPEEARRLAEHLFLLVEGAIVHRGLDGDTTAMDTARDIARALLA